MSEPLPQLKGTQRGWVVFAVALVAGLLGANAFADAVGVPRPSEGRGDWYGIAVALRIGCGLVVGFFAIAIIVLLMHATRLVLAVLRQSAQRPSQAMALALVICGAVCLLASLGFQWYLAASSQVLRPGVGNGGGAASIKFSAPGGSASQQVSVSGSGVVEMGPAPSPLAHGLSIALFLAGATMIAIGIWSSMAPPMPVSGRQFEERAEPVTAE